MSDSIWFIKKSPSFFSNWERCPFFEEFEDDDDEEDGEADDEEEAEAALLPEPAMISESNHMWAKTWQIPSSTAGLRLEKPDKHPANVIPVRWYIAEKEDLSGKCVYPGINAHL